MSRMGALALVFCLAVTGRMSTAMAGPEGDEGAEESHEASPTVAPAEASSAAKPTSRRASEQKRRRKSKVVGFAVPESQLRTEPLPKPSGFLHVKALYGGDEADVSLFNDDGSYDVDALRELDHVLRCKRTDVEKPIDPRLYVILSHIYDHFGGKTIDIVSGFRNQRRMTSFHYRASASDIRIAGVAPKKIRAFAETLDAGGMGIGLYPRSLFVHVDVRPLPSFRWIDNARPNPNSPDKRPPRGWKRKKLQS